MANNTDILNDGGKIFYVGFKPKTFIKEHRIIKKGIKENTFQVNSDEMYLEEDRLNRVIYTFNHFNDKEADIELLEFVYNNIGNVLEWLHSNVNELVINNASGTYLDAVKNIKNKFKPYMELDNNFLINSTRSTVNRCYNPIEALVMNRLAKISGYHIWHEQCTSLGVIIYS